MKDMDKKEHLIILSHPLCITRLDVIIGLLKNEKNIKTAFDSPDNRGTFDVDYNASRGSFRIRFLQLLAEKQKNAGSRFYYGALAERHDSRSVPYGTGHTVRKFRPRFRFFL